MPDLTVHLTAELEAQLTGRAAAEGLTLEAYVERLMGNAYRVLSLADMTRSPSFDRVYQFLDSPQLKSLLEFMRDADLCAGVFTGPGYPHGATPPTPEEHAAKVDALVGKYAELPWDVDQFLAGKRSRDPGPRVGGDS